MSPGKSYTGEGLACVKKMVWRPIGRLLVLRIYFFQFINQQTSKLVKRIPYGLQTRRHADPSHCLKGKWDRPEKSYCSGKYLFKILP